MLQKKYFLSYFLLIQIAIVKIIAFFPKWIEQFYSNGLYVFISKNLRIVFGAVPFSVGDILYGILIIYVIKSILKNRKILKSNWKNILFNSINFISIFYFLFHFLWAFNYYRVPLFEKMNIKKDYSEKDLIDFTESLIVRTNEIHFSITKNKKEKVVVPFTQTQLFEMTQNGYNNLTKVHPFFNYKIRSAKISLFSSPLSYMGFSGYLNPFTNEAQVNNKVPKYGLPMTICHEMAHQIGYASESECNFIGFLAASKNDDLYFQYAANTMALKYCLGIIKAKSESNNNKNIKQYLSKLNKGILKNFQEDKDFNKNYQSFVEVGFKIFYDNFLKMNQQKEGLESYSKFLNLLINYEKTNSV